MGAWHNPYHCGGGYSNCNFLALAVSTTAQSSETGFWRGSAGMKILNNK